MAIDLILCRFVLDRHIKKQKASEKCMQPENRPPPMIVGEFMVPMGLFLYGWSANFQLQWMVPIVRTALLGFGLIVTTIPAFGYLVDTFGIHSVSAVAASIMLRRLAGSITNGRPSVVR